MADASRISTPEVRALTQQLVDMQRRLDRLERGQRASQLGYSSLDDGTLWVRDGQGINRVAIGRQVDGKFGWGAVNGDPAPRPNTPQLVSTTAGFNIKWNGEFAGIKPSDFTYVVAYASPAGDTFATDDSLIVGRLFGAGVIPVTALNEQPIQPDLSYWVRLVAYNTSGIASEESLTAGPIQASPVVATEILDGIVDTLALADDAVTAAKIAVGQINADHVTFTAQDLGSIVTYAQAAAPAAPIAAGSLWLDTDDGNKLHRWDGDSWEPATDADIAAALTAATQAQTDAANALDTAAAAEAKADGKVTTYFAATAPATPNLGDLWFDGDNNNKLHRWDGDSWELVDDQQIADAVAAAATAQSTADGKIESFYQANEPAGVAVGDLWYDTDNGNRVSRWNGTAWTGLPSGTDAIADDAITSPKVVAEAIQALHIAAEQIFAGHIAAEQITGAHIEALAIVAGHIAANQIEAGHIQAGAVTADKLEAILVLASQIIAGDQNDWHLELGDANTPILYWNGEETGFAVSRDPATGQANVYMSGRVEFGNGSQIEQDYLDLCEQPSSGFQTPSPRQMRHWIQSSPTSSITARWQSATQPGNLILITVYQVAGSGSEAPTCSVPSGSTLVDSRVSGNARLTLFAFSNSTGSRTTEPFSTSGVGAPTARWVIGLFEYTGISATALDVQAWDAGTGTTASSGTTGTTSQANELHFAVFGASNIGFTNGANGQWNNPTNGFTKLIEGDGSAGMGFAAFTKNASSTNATGTQVNPNKSVSWIGLVATFRCAPADGVPSEPPTSVTRLFTLNRGGKSTPHVIDDTGAIYPMGRVPYCSVRFNLPSYQNAAGANVPAQGDWIVSADPYGMVAIGASSTPSNITIPVTGKYLIDFRVIWQTSSVNTGSVACWVLKNSSSDQNTSVARDVRNYNIHGEGSPSQATRIVPLVAGDILYWGTWTSGTGSFYNSVLNIPTEISVQYLGPS